MNNNLTIPGRNTCKCGVVNQFPRRFNDGLTPYKCDDCKTKEEALALDNQVNELLGDYLCKHDETKITVRDLRIILKKLIIASNSNHRRLSELNSRTSGLIVYGAHKHT